MRSQWDCLLQNLGCWQGSFARLSPQGEILEDIPSETSLELKEDQQTMRQVVRRFYDGQPQDLVLEYRTLNKCIILFENGAFSQGTIQFSPVTNFGAELGLIYGNRRLRIILLYDKTSKLEQLTLIREHLPHSNTPEYPPLTLDALLGKWEGEAVTLSPNWLIPEVTPTVTEWQRDGDRVIMSLQMSTALGTQTSSSVAHINSQYPQILKFEQNHIQTLFLPNGSSVTGPETIIPRQPFHLSISWLLEPNLHQRMIRSYNQQGGWENLTLVTEHKVG